MDLNLIVPPLKPAPRDLPTQRRPFAHSLSYRVSCLYSMFLRNCFHVDADQLDEERIRIPLVTQKGLTRGEQMTLEEFNACLEPLRDRLVEKGFVVHDVHPDGWGTTVLIDSPFFLMPADLLRIYDRHEKMLRTELQAWTNQFDCKLPSGHERSFTAPAIFKGLLEAAKHAFLEGGYQASIRPTNEGEKSQLDLVVRIPEVKD